MCVWEVRGLGHFHLVGGEHRDAPNYHSLTSHFVLSSRSGIGDYRGVELLGSLKPHHPSLSTFQSSPLSFLSLVPMFTVELSREEQREMGL